MKKGLYGNTLNFEIYVADLIEAMGPETIEEMEEISEALHNSLEIGIRDYLDCDDILDYDDYIPVF